MDWGNVNRKSRTESPFNFIFLQILFRYIYSLIHGCVMFSFVILYILLSTPVFIYRILITRLVAPVFHPKIGKPVTPISNAYATDLYHNQRAPRTAIVVDLVLEGNISLEEVFNLLTTELINETGDNGQLVYPELKQYVEPWMGFLFWKQDFKFNVKNHVSFHKLEEQATELECETFACQLIEEQLNKTFPSKKSPWEVHVVHNYKMKGNKSNRPSSLIIFRFQHCIADGYSILYALVEGLGKVSLTKISHFSKNSLSSQKNDSLYENIKEVVNGGLQFIKRFLHDVDYAVTLFSRDKSPWFVPDEKKQWKQLYARSDLLSIDKLKEIKNRLGASFTGVILSAISAGVSKSLKAKGKGENEDIVDVLPTFSTIPLPGHPKGLSNHHAGVVFDIPVKIDLNPVDRLVECESFLALAKQSLLLPLAVVVWKLLGCQLAALNAKIFSNPLVPAFLTNFPGPALPVVVHGGRKMLAASFAVGAGSGVAGIGFMAFSYHDKMRIVLTAENATMTRDELQRMLSHILEEIEILHEIALSKIPDKKQLRYQD